MISCSDHDQELLTLCVHLCISSFISYLIILRETLILPRMDGHHIGLLVWCYYFCVDSFNITWNANNSAQQYWSTIVLQYKVYVIYMHLMQFCNGYQSGIRTWFRSSRATTTVWPPMTHEWATVEFVITMCRAWSRVTFEPRHIMTYFCSGGGWGVFLSQDKSIQFNHGHRGIYFTPSRFRSQKFGHNG